MTLPHNKNIYSYPARFQYQTGAPCSGSSTCTDTVIQMIVEYYKDKTYSLAYIRRMAQAKTAFNEGPCTGINYVEVLNALRAFGIYHYRVGWDVTWSTVANRTVTGPVLVGVYYGNYPNQVGKCGPIKALHGGRTQCTFRGAHAILAIGKQVYNGKTTIVTRDPNHHSASRPEAPKFDRITPAQLSATMRALVPNTAFSRTYCIYPTLRK